MVNTIYQKSFNALTKRPFRLWGISLLGARFGSRMRTHPISPVSVTSPPKIAKNFRHCPRCVIPSNAPKITSIDSSGSTANTPSVFPRLSSEMLSVM